MIHTNINSFSLFSSIRTFLSSTLFVSSLALAQSASAQTVLQYADGEDKSAVLDTSTSGYVLEVGSGSAATQSGAITGTGDIFKMGIGSLYLTGANDYSGGTLVGGGVLKMTQGGSIVNTLSVVVGEYPGYPGGSSEGILVVDGAGGGASVTTAGETSVGDGGAGSLQIIQGGEFYNTSSGSDFVVGAMPDSNGSVRVADAGSLLDVAGYLYVGSSGTGTVLVENGGTMKSKGLAFIGSDEGAGTVTVTGSNSAWDGSSSSASVPSELVVGYGGKGTLNVLAGGSVSGFDFASIGNNGEGDGEDGDGTVTVSGSNSTLSVGDLSVGGTGQGGVLNIFDGGRVLASGFASIGDYLGEEGTINVDGVGSVLELTDDILYIGYEGVGTLNLSNGGLLDQSTLGIHDPVTLGFEAGSQGTLNIGADPTLAGGPVGAGLVDAVGVEGWDGDATLNFNHTETDYFFTNNGLESGTAVKIRDSIKVGHYAGTTTLNGDNNYTGGTTIYGGTLNVAHSNGLGTGAVINEAELNFSDGVEIDNVIENRPNGITSFRDLSSASNATIANAGGILSGEYGGLSFFYDSSTAGNAAIRNAGGTVDGTIGGGLVFDDFSTADDATISNHGATVLGANGGITYFVGNSSAGLAAITNYGSAVADAGGDLSIGQEPGGRTVFTSTATAGSAAINNLGSTMSGSMGGATLFYGTASANQATLTNHGATVDGVGGGSTIFFEDSSAGAATLNNLAGTVSGALGGVTGFDWQASAGDAAIHNRGSAVAGASSGWTIFRQYSSAGNATITNHTGVAGGGVTLFSDNSTLANATIITEDKAYTFFQGLVNGGEERFDEGSLITNAGGTVDFSRLTTGGIIIGSIAGAGDYYLGSHDLVVGGNNQSTQVSGVISDGSAPAPAVPQNIQDSLSPVAGTGTGGWLVKAGTGTLTLSGANTYTGGTNVGEGTLVGNSDSLQGNIYNSAQLTFDQSTDGTYAAGGVISGTGDLAKTGAGKLTLSEEFTYTGVTNVNEGTLALSGSGSLSSTSAISIASGAVFDVSGVPSFTLGSGQTLGGTGSVVGLATIGSGGILSPGNSPGTLTFADGLTLNDGAILDFEFGNISDLILVTGGTLTGSASAGGITLNLSDSGDFDIGTYTLIDFTGAILSNFDPTRFAFGSTIAGYDYSLGINGNTLELTAIPEPATTALLAGGAILLAAVCFRRRRQQQS